MQECKIEIYRQEYVIFSLVGSTLRDLSDILRQIENLFLFTFKLKFSMYFSIVCISKVSGLIINKM
jgi:hypothetical protein